MTASELVDDVHSALNATRVRAVLRPRTEQEVVAALARARAGRLRLTAAGGRHAMGGQQFATDGLLLDTGGLDRVGPVDAERGLVEVGAGVQWPQLVAALARQQAHLPPSRRWGVRQKQTGADRFSIGGSVSVNAHGRGLALPPMASDVESVRVVLPDGRAADLSRDQEPDLFRAVLGGYGLFGVVVSVVLRLAPRRVLQRDVELATTEDLAECVAGRVGAGYLYGDLQPAVDAASPGFLRDGVFSCYRPAQTGGPDEDEGAEAVPGGQLALSRGDWAELLELAHRDKPGAFERYVRHYLATSGQRYWSDTHQLADYEDGYHRRLDALLGGPPASEVIGEVYVPPAELAGFARAAAEDLRERAADVVYGTVRFVEADVDTALPWARRRSACLVLNLHTEHTPEGTARSAAAFQRLIDLALDRGGSYFLTYHRWARPDQLLRAYPELPAVVAHQREVDPHGLLHSDWYREHVLPAVASAP
ncbi:FAD-binding oxidoreductase [Streptomyces sp. NP160]|uniref:FAD-binding oxidoreductase n=1 Tax=Streptomyces sp. NP160 TaxID=2586637 RepID=UPI0011184E27|nr:FAD-binding oxidoreductase [Streptomyces sp. NP160]TNM64421.1 FAD-binding oxidoreductase [Streptomyces sp. NP160]